LISAIIVVAAVGFWVLGWWASHVLRRPDVRILFWKGNGTPPVYHVRQRTRRPFVVTWHLFVPLVVWALLPWFFWLLIRSHKRFHIACPLWKALGALLVVASMPGAVLVSNVDHSNPFPLSLFVLSSALDLVIGLLILWLVIAVAKWRSRRNLARAVD
jgi:hypothetical protein